ncbi:Baculoviral IAP repeat-containing protein 1f [Frankliniella fusca]|uniref:Baculoviral IAP repeat-containing protein 1f n=1 Tax=Frankliniella fusca TaxID=407009 RepID=A0AAE1LNV7_9NEOP|nr:Baculoviral IAP repeat-containing protein 1f [Frankliniella fusca]KAK3915990.1 Baculoviral IAP repeat-containing protein 1f [Frankliniella fusca]KAK3926315.1 Baculoviral IAP repeat-containing protein 1f [Frankliniella fusca]
MDTVALTKSIVNWAKKVMTNLVTSDLLKIAEYLTSPAVGITCFEEFGDVTEEMLSDLDLAPVKKNRLLKALLQEATPVQRLEPSAKEPTPSSSNSFSAQSSSQRQPQLLMPNAYSFRVPWNALPKELIKKLEKAKLSDKKAHYSDIAELKLAIAKKLQADYSAFKSSHPRAQKHPGRAVYRSVANEVGRKFGVAIQDSVNGRLVSSSFKTFERRLEICVENKYRDKNYKRKVVKGKGTVGVLQEEHHPTLTEASREEQVILKENMKGIFQMDPTEWDWLDTNENIKSTYALQRDDIYNAKQGVITNDANEEQEQEGNEDEDNPEENHKVMERLKSEWPFLFQLEGLQIHHKRLTGRDLEAAYESFVEEHLSTMLTFMVTKTGENNEDNMALKMYVETIEGVDSGKKFLMLIEMLCTIFKEEISKFILPVEKTSQPDLFEYSCLEQIPYPCIVALDSNKYMALKYCVCADKVSLTVTSCPADAILALFYICFNFDLEYPPQLPLLFEFIERFIFGMGVVDTKVKTKQGHEIVVLTERVRKLSEDYERFKEDFQKKCEAYTK